jgi:predicted DNA-binding transcriptional regulator AlpA
MTDLKSTPRGIDISQLCAKLGGKKPLDPSTVWRRIRRDLAFPQPYYLWDSAPRFVEEEIDAYVARKIAERDDPVSAAAQRERVDRRGQRLSEARDRAREAKAKPRLKRRYGSARR